MATRRVATVFGGSGFIGRYVVKRLAQQGYVVRVAVRDPEAALFLKPMGAVGQVVPLYASVMNEGTVHRAVAGAEVVVNLVGALTESRAASFQAVHTEGAERIARIVRRHRCPPADPCLRHRRRPGQPQPLRATKGKAEQAVLAAFPDGHDPAAVHRVRRGGQVLQPLCGIARLSPIMPVISGDDQDAAGVRRRRCRRGDGGAGDRRLDGQNLRTWRPAGMDIPGDPGLHSEADAAQQATDGHPDGNRPDAGLDPAARAWKAADAGSAIDAGSRTMSCRRARWVGRSWYHANTGGTGGARLP